jgi:hypothetical protein
MSNGAWIRRGKLWKMSPRSTPIVIPTLERLRGLEMMCCECFFMRIGSFIFERPSHLSYHAIFAREIENRPLTASLSFCRHPDVSFRGLHGSVPKEKLNLL